MSAYTHNDRSTDRQINDHQLAAEIGVDCAQLVQFVDLHPNPTADIVLGWANRHGNGEAEPDAHAADVEAWLAQRGEATARGGSHE